MRTRARKGIASSDAGKSGGVESNRSATRACRTRASVIVHEVVNVVMNVLMNVLINVLINVARE